MDKQKIALIVLSVLLLFSFAFVYYQSERISALSTVINTQKNIAKVEKDNQVVDVNNEKLKLLLKDKIDAYKKIETLEVQLIKLRASKPRKESISNETKDYSINDVSSFFHQSGYPNEVLCRNGDIFQLQYSSKASR